MPITELQDTLLFLCCRQFPFLTGTLSEIKLLKACIHIHKHMQENTPRNLFYIFRQQGNLLHFKDMLNNLCLIFQKMLFIS
jgi:hypothetical protein